MPPEQYKGNVRHMLYEMFIEDQDQLIWLLSSDEAGAKFGRWGLDNRIVEEGEEIRRECEERGVVVRQISDVSLGWLGVMYDFLNDEDTFRAIIDEIEEAQD